MLTIAEIAQLAGVSKTTVSNVLNGKIGQVSEETRQRILKIIEESGYTPHQAARALKSKRNRTIALLFPHIPLRLVSNSFFFPGFLTGVAEVCERFGYRLLVTTSYKDCDTDFYYERLLKTRSIDGLIVSDIFYDDPRFVLLKRSRIPFVSIGKPEGGDIEGIYWVDHDQEYLAGKATDYLVNLGHRDIVFVGLSSKRVYTLQRLRGYKKALEKAGISFRREFILCEEMWGTEAETKIITFLQGLPFFTAVFAIGGHLTIQCWKALEKLNRRISQDVSLLGNVEAEGNMFLDVCLSGIRVRPQTLGYATAKTLIDLIGGKNVEQGRFLEADFVEGESCNRARDCTREVTL